MKLKYIIISLILFFVLNASLPCYSEEAPKPPLKVKELKQLDKEIAQRLSLTEEQLKVLKINRSKNLKTIEETIKKMEITRKKIHNIYILGIPKYQADLRTAPMKIELAMLKQSADRIRTENRKNFEKILTDEQKIEFEKLKKEFQERRPLENND